MKDVFAYNTGGRKMRQRLEKGRAYLQTFSPEHYVLNLAADQNYDEFSDRNAR